MANQPYPAGLEAFGNGELDWVDDTWHVVLVTSSYTFSSAHEDYDDLSNIIGEATISGMTNSGGVLDASDTLVTSISSGTIDAAIIVHWTGTSSTSKVFMFFDTGINFDLDPSGDVLVRWPDTAGVKIFPLGGRVA